MTSKYNLVRVINIAILGISSSTISIPALSQESETLEEVVVTGSRIARNPLDYVGPMTVVNNEAIVKANAITVEEVLRELPAVTLNATNENDSNAGQGVRSVELRNLGEERTLVLVNGRRYVQTVLGSGLVYDLNNFPINMIERVEVLGDGSSAVYGSDAVGGVVNVILKDDFEGVELGAGGGVSSESDGERFDLSFVMGGNFERGNITFGVSYAEEQAVYFSERDWAEIPVIADFGGGSRLLGSGIPPGGKYNSPDGSVSLAFVPDAATGLDYTDCTGPNAQSIDGFEPCRFNYNLGNNITLLNPNQKTAIFLRGNYELNNGLEAFAEISFTDREGTQLFPGLPVSGAHGKYTDMIPVPFTNPFIPADALAVIQAAEGAGATSFMMDWRAQDAGTRDFEYQGETISTLIGVEGEFADNWTWDAYFNWGRSETFEETLDQVNATNLRIAVDPAQCALIPDCEVIDIFGRGDVSQAAADFILFDDTELNEYEMFQLAGNISGDLGEWEAGTIGFAAGFEYREEEGGSRKSAVTQAGDSGGNFSQPTFGDYDVKEVYVEFSIPLLSDAVAAEELTLDLATRYSDYDTIGDDTTYKVGLSWRPIEDLRFRAVVSTAFRAPNIMELFSGVADSFDQVGDPCSGFGNPANNTSAVVIANCLAAGVPTSYVQNAGQLKISEGGNTELEAEEADNITVGVVYTPRQVENLSFTIDYYDIEVDNAIDKLDPQTVINNCFNSPGLSSSDCTRIGRNASGQVVRFDLLNENLALIETSGVDFSANYLIETDSGQITINWLGNYLIEYNETDRNGIETKFVDTIAGTISDFSGYPRIRSNLSFGFTRDNWDVTFTHRYIHDADAIPLLPSLDVTDEVDAVNYFDLSGSIEFGTFSVLAGIENITDEEPEFIPEISTNTSAVYDWMGRYYYTKLSYKF